MKIKYKLEYAIGKFENTPYYFNCESFDHFKHMEDVKKYYGISRHTYIDHSYVL